VRICTVDGVMVATDGVSLIKFTVTFAAAGADRLTANGTD